MPKSLHQPSRTTSTNFTFDLPRMMEAIDGGVISFPPGLSREERRVWVAKALKERKHA